MLDTLQWLQDLKVSEMVHNARDSIILKLNQEYSNEAKAYLASIAKEGLPFGTPFSQEPDPIIEIKTFLNALFYAEETFRDLETALSQALGKKNVFTYTSLLSNAPLVNKAYDTIELLAKFGSNFFDLFKDELKMTVPYLLQLKQSLPDIPEQYLSCVPAGTHSETVTELPASDAKRVGLFLGHVVNQMKPIEGQVDYSLLTQFGALLPIYIRQLGVFIEEHVSKISNNTPEDNKEKIAELDRMGEQLGLLIQNSAEGKLFLIAHLFPLIRHIQNLLAQLTQAAGSLSDTIKNTLYERLVVLKLELITGVFAFIDKSEIELLLRAGRLSKPLMVQLKPVYETLSQAASSVVDFSIKGDSLIKLADRRFLELRLAPTRKRLDRLQKSLYLVDEALKALNVCIAELGIDKPPERSMWNALLGASTTMTNDEKITLNSNYKALQAYLIELEHPIIEEINTALHANGSNEQMRALFARLKPVLEQVKTDSVFKIKLHDNLIKSVYEAEDIVLFPYNRIQDQFHQLTIARRDVVGPLSSNDLWDRYRYYQNQYDDLSGARDLCDFIRFFIHDNNDAIFNNGISFYPDYAFHALDDHVIHQSNVLYLKAEGTTLYYEVLQTRKAEESPVHLMSLESAKAVGHGNCYIWDEQTHQLFYIDENRTVQKEVFLKNTILFKSAIDLKKYRPAKKTIVFTADLIEKYITGNGGHVPGIVHKGHMPLNVLSDTLLSFSSPQECKPYQARLLQELNERGHIFSTCRSDWVRAYSVLQPYLIQAFKSNADIIALDKQIVAAFTGNFFDYNVTKPDSVLMRRLDNCLETLHQYLVKEIASHNQSKQVYFDEMKQTPSFVRQDDVIAHFHKAYISDVAELMSSAKPIHQYLYDASKRLFKLDLSLYCLRGFGADENLLSISKHRAHYNNFLYLQETLLMFQQHLKKNHRPYAVITRKQLEPFLVERRRLEREFIKHNELILDLLRQQRPVEWDVRSCPFVETQLNEILLGAEDGLERLVWFQYQLNDLQRAEQDVSIWLDYVERYQSTKNEHIRQQANVLYIYIQSYLIEALKQDKYWRVDTNTSGDFLFGRVCQIEQASGIIVSSVKFFFRQKTDELAEKCRKFKKIANTVPSPMTLLAEDLTQNRASYLIKTTCGSEQIKQLKQTILCYKACLDEPVLQRLQACSSGLPFPEVDNPKTRLSQPKQLLAMKKAANLFYYVEQVVTELESVQRSTWYYYKVTYVWHFITIYLHSIQIQALIIDVLKDKYVNSIVNDKILAIGNLTEATKQQYDRYVTVEAANTTAQPGNQSAMVQWITIVKCFPERLQAGSQEDFNQSPRFLLLKRSAEKTARNLEKIISDLNPVVRYLLLGLDGFKIRRLFHDIRNIFYDFCLNVNKKITDNLSNINTDLLFEFTLEADLIEHQLGLDNGLLSNVILRISNEFYNGFIYPLTQNMAQRFALNCQMTLMEKRLSAATKRLNMAQGNRDQWRAFKAIIDDIYLSQNDIGRQFYQHISLVKSMVNGADLRLMSLSDCKSKRFVDCFTWDDSSLFYVDPQGKVHGDTAGALYLLSCSEQSLLPKRLADKPTLIKQGERYFIYGNSATHGWGYTQLTAAIASLAKLSFYPMHGFPIKLKTMDETDSLDECSAHGISTPTLVKHGERYFLYGRKKLGAWEYTELDALVINRNLIDFDQATSIIVNGHNNYKELYRHIQFKQAHKKIAMNKIEFNPKLQAIYDEIADKKAHIFPIRVDSIAKIWTMVEKKKRAYKATELLSRANSGGNSDKISPCLYLTEQEVTKYILSNSQFLLNKQALNFSEHCWDSLHVFEPSFCASIITIKELKESSDKFKKDVIRTGDVIFLKRDSIIDVCYGMINGQYHQMRVEEPHIQNIINQYAQDMEKEGLIETDITNLPHLYAIKHYITLFEISALIQRAHHLGAEFEPTLKEINLIREITALCSSLCCGLLQTEALNIEKATHQVQFLENQYRQASISDKIMKLCTENLHFQSVSTDYSVSDDYSQTLNRYLKEQVASVDKANHAFDFDGFLSEKKAEFDSHSKYQQLDALLCVLFEFDAYLKTVKNDMGLSAKHQMIDHMISLATKQDIVAGQRIESIKGYLNDESHLRLFLMPPTVETYSFAAITQFIAKLLEVLGLYTPQRVQHTDKLVHVLLDKPENSSGQSSHSMGFFSRRPTQASVLSTWEGNATSLRAAAQVSNPLML
jgi:hypothetical protein